MEVQMLGGGPRNSAAGRSRRSGDEKRERGDAQGTASCPDFYRVVSRPTMLKYGDRRAHTDGLDDVLGPGGAGKNDGDERDDRRELAPGEKSCEKEA